MMYCTFCGKQIEELSSLYIWITPDPGEANPSESVDNDMLPTDGNRIILDTRRL